MTEPTVDPVQCNGLLMRALFHDANLSFGNAADDEPTPPGQRPAEPDQKTGDEHKLLQTGCNSFQLQSDLALVLRLVRGKYALPFFSSSIGTVSA